MNRVPKFITEQYPGGAREFKSERRQALIKAKKAVKDLSFGISYAPADSLLACIQAEVALDRLSHLLSIKNWGR